MNVYCYMTKACCYLSALLIYYNPFHPHHHYYCSCSYHCSHSNHMPGSGSSSVGKRKNTRSDFKAPKMDKTREERRLWNKIHSEEAMSWSFGLFMQKKKKNLDLKNSYDWQKCLLFRLYTRLGINNHKIHLKWNKSPRSLLLIFS